MTNKEAIKIVEDMIESMNDIDVLYAHEQDALTQLIQTAKDYDALINMSCFNISNISKEDEEKLIDKLNEVGNVGYMISVEDMKKHLEKWTKNDRRTD